MRERAIGDHHAVWERSLTVVALLSPTHRAMGGERARTTVRRVQPAFPPNKGDTPENMGNRPSARNVGEVLGGGSQCQQPIPNARTAGSRWSCNHWSVCCHATVANVEASSYPTLRRRKRATTAERASRRKVAAAPPSALTYGVNRGLCADRRSRLQRPRARSTITT